jgi:hypothetical protein
MVAALPQTPVAHFAERPCPCCVAHTPVPLQVELHHLHPRYDQVALWGEVRNRTVAPLCRTAHRNLHVFLTALMAGRPLPKVNAHTAALAREGYRLILAAHQQANVPIPPGGGGE